MTKTKSDHLCNLKGFGAIGDVCPACEEERMSNLEIQEPSDEAKLAFIKAHTNVEGAWFPSDKWEQALTAGLKAAYAVDFGQQRRENK